MYYRRELVKSVAEKAREMRAEPVGWWEDARISCAKPAAYHRQQTSC